MTTSSDTDLKELKNLINNRFDKLEERIKALEVGQTKLEIGQAKIETRLEEWKPAIQKIPDLIEKVGELKNWKQIALIVITVFGGGLFGWFLRSGKL